MNIKQLWKQVYGLTREGKSINKIEMTDEQRVIMNDLRLSYWQQSDDLDIDYRLEIYKTQKRGHL